MQKTEKELKDTVMEHTPEKTISERRRTETITVTKTEGTSINLHQSRLNKLLHPQFFEVAICPHIVVALKEIHIDSSVQKFLNRSKNPDITLRTIT